MTSKEGTTDDLYFEWLYGLVASVRNRNPERSYWRLLRQLYTKQFVWHVANDDNREEDGKELRDEFIFDQDIEDIEPFWLDLGCSFLEMLIALSRRAAFEAGGEPVEWFWKLMNNLGLRECTDAVYNKNIAKGVDEALDRVINRTYERNGAGGLFPLHGACDDQRRVELWYQLSAYIIDGNSVDG